MNNELERYGSGHGLIYGTILAFAWRNGENDRESQDNLSLG
jgi:hypothetical protein